MTTAEFPGRYDSLAAIAEFIRRGAEEFGLDDCATYAVETAVDEACSNIIEHAYGGENLGIITCSYEAAGQDFIIRLQDTGRSFRPDEVPHPNIKGSLDDRMAHGLGLYFMRQWMDEVKFDFSNGVNTLTMVKRKESSS